ncbi:Spo7-like protein-domain-containing protein [Scheffersomyces xylosifermentans]|uniref:Spo7-like protein-domain-containing protein n=1 Tax=Scheffersomyces xylosifermentans TaxID=1304137 RepID=UPI00315DAED7
MSQSTLESDPDPSSVFYSSLAQKARSLQSDSSIDRTDSKNSNHNIMNEISDDHVPSGNASESSTRPSSPTLASSISPKSPAGHSPKSGNRTLLNDYDLVAPRSPLMSSADSTMNITPFSSHSELDDFVVFSDSDGASQSSLDLKNIASGSLSPLGEGRLSPPSLAGKGSTKRSSGTSTPKRRTKSSSPKRNSPIPDVEDTPSAKSKRRIRRKSNKSDNSEKSHRSSVRHNSEYVGGTGYTSMPATGKIFRNLLILEESLREQVIQQRALRRKYLTFLAVLCSLIASISHHLFILDPAVTSVGTKRVILQFTLLALLVTLMLYHLSGEYQKTIVLPRKFLSSTNKGLRQLNVRLVKIKTSMSDKVIDFIREISSLLITLCLSCLHYVYPSAEGNKDSKFEVFLVSCQSQCQPRIGVSDVKLVLNARVFNTDIREGWELYRSEFWVLEGVRRRNNMMAFASDGQQVLDKGRLLKKDKKERKERRKSGNTTKDVGEGREGTPIANRLSEQNLQKLSRGFDEKTDERAPFPQNAFDVNATPTKQ